MNIQIFGTNKCFDTKKAIRYFKERNIKVQFVDLKEKGLSKGEYTKVKQAVGGLDAMLNPKWRCRPPHDTRRRKAGNRRATVLLPVAASSYHKNRVLKRYSKKSSRIF